MKSIKRALQRMWRGYDDTIKWGFAEYLYFIVKPLKEFCQEELRDTEHMALNPERKEVYETTLKLIDNYEHDEDILFETEKEFWKYFGEHIGYYWN